MHGFDIKYIELNMNQYLINEFQKYQILSKIDESAIIEKMN